MFNKDRASTLPSLAVVGENQRICKDVPRIDLPLANVDLGQAKSSLGRAQRNAGVTTAVTWVHCRSRPMKAFRRQAEPSSKILSYGLDAETGVEFEPDGLRFSMQLTGDHILAA
jgi:hypothetical protein